MTTVELYKDIGLNMAMKKTIDFTSKSQQDNWFTSHNPLYINNVAYNKADNALHVPMQYGDAIEYTYIRLRGVDNTGRVYYYFISDCALIDDSIVSFSLVLDPIQTFMCEFELDECMITRAHVDRWIGSNIKRITPVSEGVNAFTKVNSKKKLVGYNDFALVCISLTSPRFKVRLRIHLGSDVSDADIDVEMDKQMYYALAFVDLKNPNYNIPFVYKRGMSSKVFDEKLDWENDTLGRMIFPSLNDILNGNLQRHIPTTDDAIVSISMLPISTIKLEFSEEYQAYRMNPDISTWFTYERNKPMTVQEYQVISLTDDYPLGADIYVDNLSTAVETVENPGLDLDGGMGLIIRGVNELYQDNLVLDCAEAWSTPQKPNNNSNKSPVHEPALYMQPFTERKIVQRDGTEILTIPDIDIKMSRLQAYTTFGQGTINLNVLHSNSRPSGGSALDDEIATDKYNEGEYGVMMPIQLDVVNDNWKSYVITKQQTDRQLVSNQSWQRALDNLFFMSYGGALVGSRGASGRNDGARGGEGVFNSKYSPKVAGAIGLAAGASIATSLIDAHYAWQNQLIKEKQVRNESTEMQFVGDGLQTILMHLKDIYYVEKRVDDVNYERAYENFSKYGYMVNEYTKLDIRSRKYFNYVLTNGAIIKGDMSQSIKDLIASVFDNGITIFHGDNTSTLEYESITKENIERSLI